MAQIPEIARRQHRVASGKGPVGAMQGVGELPEPLAARELLAAFGLPAAGIAPDLDRGAAIAKLHRAGGIQGAGGRWCHLQVGQQSPMAATRLQARHLGGPHVKVVGAAAETAGAAAALVMGLQQQHPLAGPGQQRRRREPGDAGAHHHYLILGLIGPVDGARLAHREALVSRSPASSLLARCLLARCLLARSLLVLSLLGPLAVSVLPSSLLPVLLAKGLPKVLPKVLVDGMLAGLWYRSSAGRPRPR